jgi:hypothetical protein
MEDISPEEGQKILDRARKTMKDVIDNKVTYSQDRGPLQMDCTLFNAIAMRDVVGDKGIPEQPPLRWELSVPPVAAGRGAACRRRVGQPRARGRPARSTQALPPYLEPGGMASRWQFGCERERLGKPLGDRAGSRWVRSASTGRSPAEK